MQTIQKFLFEVYPYICLSVFLIGSWIRFDREQYSWRSGSSQMLRAKQLRWGSNLFHIGILAIFAGHFVGLLAPHGLYTALGLTVEAKQMLAIVVGGVFGIVCWIGLTLLLHRRLTDPRIRVTSTTMDVAVLVILWIQLTLGLVTIPYSLQHPDGSVMLILSDYVQRLVTFRGVEYEAIAALDWPYRIHLALGFTLFLIFPFSRLVHIWSAPMGYVFRSYQIVRRRGGAGNA
jgi:nitrate reductase gamma subunit